ncbi:MAG: hypothetical protein WC843_06465 [Candidatus Gracilibacteria bacterium]
MSNPNSPRDLDPAEKLEELGLAVGPDGILRGNEITGFTIGLPNKEGVVLIKGPDGTEFKLEGVKGIQIKKMNVSGRGKVGIVL